MPGGRTQGWPSPQFLPCPEMGCRCRESCAPLSSLQLYSRHALPVSCHEAPLCSVTLSSVTLHTCATPTPFLSAWPPWSCHGPSPAGRSRSHRVSLLSWRRQHCRDLVGSVPSGTPPEPAPLFQLACPYPPAEPSLSHTPTRGSQRACQAGSKLNTTSLKCTEQDHNWTKILTPILPVCHPLDLK